MSQPPTALQTEQSLGMRSPAKLVGWESALLTYLHHEVLWFAHLVESAMKLGSTALWRPAAALSFDMYYTDTLPHWNNTEQLESDFDGLNDAFAQVRSTQSTRRMSETEMHDGCVGDD